MSNKNLSEQRTEDVVKELLEIQGYATFRPPKGCVVRQNEYKAFSELADIFKGRSKSGKGDAYPDFMVIAEDTRRPQAVIETKADDRDLDQALTEACNVYGAACRDAGHPVIAVGVAGQEKTGIRVAASTFIGGEWRPICHEGRPISWIPTLKDLLRLIGPDPILDVAPVVPQPQVLAEQAELINELLREAGVRDELRPAYVGAVMLGLWQSRGQISREPGKVLADVNRTCQEAFALAGKPELAQSLIVDVGNTKLANSAWRIISTLEKLNVVNASFDHDYLGQLYETFFRYTGGNTIGQYFTPRHVAVFMANLCETTRDDVVIDPACGTGGFLIACIHRAMKTSGAKYEDVVKLIQNKLIGYESVPGTAALCVANMILRGDGKTGIRKNDCFKATDFPIGGCQVALMNPPFPHKKTDTPPEEFVERALEALGKRGKLAVILPTSLLVKKPIGAWREKILKDNTLLGVCQLPDELFQPFASATTSVVLLEKGLPHDRRKKPVFVRVQYDGLTLKKGARVARLDRKDELEAAAEAIINKSEQAGFSGSAEIAGDAEWGPGAYISSAVPAPDELTSGIDDLLRRLASFYVRYAAEVARLRHKIGTEELAATDYRSMLTKSRLKNADDLPSGGNTIGHFFDIYYGQKELHSRDGIPSGDSLIISPTEQYNGCYGWLTFDALIKPPFITVAQTGSIGEAFVQLEPCGVNDDCLILLPKAGQELPLSCFFIAAAIIRSERWRFTYGRKLTPSRICEFSMSRLPTIEDWTGSELSRWESIWESAVSGYAGREEVPLTVLTELDG